MLIDGEYWVFGSFDRFVAGSNSVLLATDVAARGLDIPAVEHVIHYQVPKNTEVRMSAVSMRYSPKHCTYTTLFTYYVVHNV